MLRNHRPLEGLIRVRISSHAFQVVSRNFSKLKLPLPSQLVDSCCVCPPELIECVLYWCQDSPAFRYRVFDLR